MKTRDEARELRKLWGGFWPSRVLLTANNFGMFDHLKSPRTADEISKILKADKRAAEIILDALTGLGFLKKSAGKYKNTSLSNRFLTKDGPYYQGDIIRHADTLWHNWSGLDEVVKTGSPSRRSHNHEAFIKGMHNLASLKSEAVMKAIDLRGVKKALDLGGGPGTYSMEMAKKGVSAALFDRSETIRIAKALIGKSGAGNVNFISGDFISDDIKNGYDLIFISQVIHSYSADENIGLIKKCRRALTTGGRIAVQEFLIDKNMTHPVNSALFSVNMLVNTTGGRCYPPSEIRQFFKKAGLKNIQEKKLDDTVLVIGRNAAS